MNPSEDFVAAEMLHAFIGVIDRAAEANRSLALAQKTLNRRQDKTARRKAEINKLNLLVTAQKNHIAMLFALNSVDPNTASACWASAVEMAVAHYRKRGYNVPESSIPHVPVSDEAG